VYGLELGRSMQRTGAGHIVRPPAYTLLHMLQSTNTIISCKQSSGPFRLFDVISDSASFVGVFTRDAVDDVGL